QRVADVADERRKPLAEPGKPRARAVRQLDERRGVQRLEREPPGLVFRPPLPHRRRLLVGQVAGQLVDDVGRELAPLPLRVLAHPLPPTADLSIMHGPPRRDPESARRTGATPFAAPPARPGPRR